MYVGQSAAPASGAMIRITGMMVKRGMANPRPVGKVGLLYPLRPAGQRRRQLLTRKRLGWNMKKKVAAITPEYRRHSHADVILTKILEGYNLDGKEFPNLELVSLFCDQTPPKDMARDLAKKHGFTIYDSVEKALTRGGDKLAVNGVLCISEH